MSEQLAYVAGLFDGEGAIFIQNRKNKPGQQESMVLRISLNMKSKACVEKISKLLPGNFREDKVKANFVYAASSTMAAKALERILPYIVSKKAQANFALMFQDNVKSMRNRSPRVLGKAGSQPVLVQVMEFRKYLAGQIKHLKRAQSKIYNSIEFPMRKSEKLAYSAGLIDAEGCISATRNRSSQLRLKIKMFDRGPLERLAKILGGTVKNHGEHTVSNLPMSHVEYTGDYVACVLRQVRPFLVGKILQADLAIQISEQKNIWKILHSEKTKRLPDDLKVLIDGLSAQIRLLNGGKPKHSCAGAETKLPQSVETQISDSPTLQDDKLQELA